MLRSVTSLLQLNMRQGTPKDKLRMVLRNRSKKLEKLETREKTMKDNESLTKNVSKKIRMIRSFERCHYHAMANGEILGLEYLPHPTIATSRFICIIPLSSSEIKRSTFTRKFIPPPRKSK